MFVPGQVLAGKYRVERTIGSGGMGVVVAAEQIALQQRVAVKVLTGEKFGPAQVERFRREARAAASLRNEHVARSLDFGLLENGAPFVAMEYLDGRDLDRELAERGPLPIDEAVGYVLDACAAIAEAHAIGIVHRDIKPENLFLANVGAERVVKVLDFGIAKSNLSEDVAITRTTDVFGSPMYMAPEQMRASKDVDARSDIWALGVTLYELLTAHTPYESVSVAEVCAMVLMAPVPAIVHRRDDIPDDLAAVVHRCLEKEPDARYQTALDLAIALAPFAPPSHAGVVDRVREMSMVRPEQASVGDSSGNEEVPTITVASTHPENTITKEYTGRKGSGRAPAIFLGVGVAATVAVVLIARQRSAGHEATLDEPASSATVPASIDTPPAPSSLAAAPPVPTTPLVIATFAPTAEAPPTVSAPVAPPPVSAAPMPSASVAIAKKPRPVPAPIAAPPPKKPPRPSPPPQAPTPAPASPPKPAKPGDAL